MFSTILHPTDLSDACTPALKVAHRLAKALQAQLLICYIGHPPLIASGNTLTDPETGESRDVLDEIQRLQPLDPAVQCDVKIVLTDRSAGVKHVLGVLEPMGCDLIVVGMHEREGITSWLSGSITEEIVKRAHCAVLVVKPQADSAPEAESES
jgi:nucleotide-binding universal stress UspA family protein